MRIRIESKKNNTFKIKVLDDVDLNKLDDYRIDGKLYAYLDIFKHGTITDTQRKHYWAIIKDIVNHLGISKGQARLLTYERYLADHDSRDIVSVARNQCSKDEATNLIQSCLDFCFDNGIPLKNNYTDYFSDKQLYTLLMSRKCFIC